MTPRKRILLADDHPQTVRACRVALEEQGFEVMTADTLDRTAATAKNRGPAVIVLDADLRGGDVAEFCARLLDAGTSPTPVLMLIPPRFPPDRMNAIAAHCRDRIFKPFQVTELVRHVSSLAELADLVSGPRATGDRISEPSAFRAYGRAQSDTDIADMTGTEIAGCTLRRVLGRGATGGVYLGRHVLLDVPVAVKLMPSSMKICRAEELQRLVRGARAAARIQHPNLAGVLNAGQEKGFHFVVQRYCEGDALSSLIAARGRLSEQAVVRLLRDIAAGLGALHALDIVHRDVKPANIIISSSGTAVLTDFGLAREIRGGDISTGSALIGTPYYMSPEQCESLPLDGRSDLYALGAAAYHALTGRRPIESDAPLAVLQAHVRQVPSPPAEVLPAIAVPLSDLIMKLLEKKPEDRYQTADELLAALQGIIATDSGSQS